MVSSSSSEAIGGGIFEVLGRADPMIMAIPVMEFQVRGYKIRKKIA